MLEDNLINLKQIMEDSVFKSKQGKLYIKGLKIAVDVGAVSIYLLQKKLNINYNTAVMMLDWMINLNIVKDEYEKNSLKKMLMTKCQLDDLVKNLGYSLKTKRERQRTVDEALYKACLRLIIKQNYVSEKMLKDAFAIGTVKANAVISKMDVDGWIEINNLQWQILITKEKFEEIFE